MMDSQEFKRQCDWQEQSRETIKNPRTSQRRGPKRLRERLVQSRTIHYEHCGNLVKQSQQFGQKVRFVRVTVLVKWFKSEYRRAWNRAVQHADVEAIRFEQGDIGTEKGKPTIIAFNVRASEGQIAELLQCQSIYRTDEKDTAPQKRRIGKRKGAAKLALHDGIVYLDASIPYRCSGDGTPKVKASNKPSKGKWCGDPEQERKTLETVRELGTAETVNKIGETHNIQ